MWRENQCDAYTRHLIFLPLRNNREPGKKKEKGSKARSISYKTRTKKNTKKKNALQQESFHEVASLIDFGYQS